MGSFPPPPPFFFSLFFPSTPFLPTILPPPFCPKMRNEIKPFTLFFRPPLLCNRLRWPPPFFFPSLDITTKRNLIKFPSQTFSSSFLLSFFPNRNSITFPSFFFEELVSRLRSKDGELLGSFLSPSSFFLSFTSLTLSLPFLSLSFRKKLRRFKVTNVLSSSFSLFPF